VVFFIETVDWGHIGAAWTRQTWRAVHKGETKNCWQPKLRV